MWASSVPAARGLLKKIEVLLDISVRARVSETKFQASSLQCYSSCPLLQGGGCLMPGTSHAGHRRRPVIITGAQSVCAKDSPRCSVIVRTGARWPDSSPGAAHCGAALAEQSVGPRPAFPGEARRHLCLRIPGPSLSCNVPGVENAARHGSSIHSGVN